MTRYREDPHLCPNCGSLDEPHFTLHWEDQESTVCKKCRPDTMKVPVTTQYVIAGTDEVIGQHITSLVVPMPWRQRPPRAPDPPHPFLVWLRSIWTRLTGKVKDGET